MVPANHKVVYVYNILASYLCHLLTVSPCSYTNIYSYKNTVFGHIFIFLQ